MKKTTYKIIVGVRNRFGQAKFVTFGYSDMVRKEAIDAALSDAAVLCPSSAKWIVRVEEVA